MGHDGEERRSWQGKDRDVHPCWNWAKQVLHPLQHTLGVHSQGAEHGERQADVDVDAAADVPDEGMVPRHRLVLSAHYLSQRPCERRHHVGPRLGGVHVRPQEIASQAVVPLAGDGIIPLQGGDRPGLEQEDLPPGDGPLDVLGALQVYFQAAGQLVEPAGVALERGGPLVPALGPLQREGLGVGLAGDELLAGPADEIAGHMGVAAGDRICCEQHARDIRLDQPLHHDRDLVMLIESLGLAVGLHALAPPRSSHSVDRVADFLVGAHVEDCLELAGERCLGGVLAQGRGSDGKGDSCILLAHALKMRLCL